MKQSIHNAADFGRVAVVFGGDSAEREVSLDSGSAVLVALQRQGVKAFGIDGIPALMTAIADSRVDRVFNVLHGTDGEDGVLQGLLRACKMPVTGSSVLGSALAMDKIRSKYIWQQQQLPTAEFVGLTAGQTLTDSQLSAVEQWLPVVVKPNEQGSTVGISIARQMPELLQAITAAREFGESVIIERYINGEDYTVAFVHDQVLPSIRIRPEHGFYDYQAKYESDNTEYASDTLTAAVEQDLQALALRAAKAVAVTGWGRVDFMREPSGKAWLLEVNTVPGMTSHSLVPKAAQAAGYQYDQLVWSILETAMPELQQ